MLEIEVGVVAARRTRKASAGETYTTPEDTLEAARRLNAVPGARSPARRDVRQRARRISRAGSAEAVHPREASGRGGGVRVKRRAFTGLHGGRDPSATLRGAGLRWSR